MIVIVVMMIIMMSIVVMRVIRIRFACAGLQLRPSRLKETLSRSIGTEGAPLFVVGGCTTRPRKPPPKKRTALSPKP